MNFYNNAALVLDHLDKHPGSVKGSLAASGVQVQGGEAKRVLACALDFVSSLPLVMHTQFTLAPLHSGFEVCMY